jgi:hypothetical protein
MVNEVQNRIAASRALHPALHCSHDKFDKRRKRALTMRTRSIEPLALPIAVNQEANSPD